jgi:hypothetical protein
MKTEMDLLHMDERQRLAWLMANRGTVIAVGAVWIGMIVWELAESRTPLFLILMLPVFALLRLGFFLYYLSIPMGLGGRRGGRGAAWYARIVAAFLLAVSLLLPLYSTGGPLNSDAGRRYGYAWQLVLDDWYTIIPLVFAFLWPVPILLLSRKSSRGLRPLLTQFLEPLLAAASSVVILWIPQLIFDYQQVLFWFVLTPTRAEVGCYLAVSANGIYFVSWLSESLRPWATSQKQSAG